MKGGREKGYRARLNEGGRECVQRMARQWTKRGCLGIRKKIEIG